MKAPLYIIPILIIVLFIGCKIKKIDVYSGFSQGAKKAIPLLTSLFCYICAVIFMTEIFKSSGLSDKFEMILAPVLAKIGIPEELTSLIVLKPFSANASLAVLTDIYSSYGIDSYLSRVASCIYFSSETIFYVSAVYFARCKNKKVLLPIIICLLSFFCSVELACLICRFI